MIVSAKQRGVVAAAAQRRMVPLILRNVGRALLAQEAGGPTATGPAPMPSSPLNTGRCA